jgi:hypothetical protein
MADYIFKVYLHTDKVRLSNGDIPTSEYTFILPSFYFTLNEYVSAKAEINISNSLLSCRGANTYNAVGAIGGLGSETCNAIVSGNNIISTIYAYLSSKALAQASEIQYTTINDFVEAETVCEVTKV